MLVQLDFCSGVGAGFPLAGLITGGFELVGLCEWDEYYRDILAKRFGLEILNDVKNCDWELWQREQNLGIDVITASPPCQPFSLQGKRKGAGDERNCFGAILRALSSLQPKFFAIENVPGLLTCPLYPGDPIGSYFSNQLLSLQSAGTMHNGFVSVADTLERPSLENGYCPLESPNALSSTGKGRPPGQSRLEAQLKKLGVLESREVLNPQFLEKAYNLPLDWTNPQELRAATELLEQDALHSAIASIPELQVSPSAASSTLIPSVNNYSRGVLGETNLYASVFPLELKSDDWERNKKVLGDSNYLAPVFPLELKQRRSLVQEKTNSYAFVLPLELKQEQNLVLGNNQNNSVVESELTTKRKASGWLERYTKTKKLKGGTIATYPRVEGERDSNNSEHWFWSYRWEEKRDTAKSDNGYVTRAVSLPKNKVEAVQIALARKWSQEKILIFIQRAEDK